MKKIYFDAPTEPHIFFRSMLENPPEGFVFITNPGSPFEWVRQLTAGEVSSAEHGLARAAYLAKGKLFESLYARRDLFSASSAYLTARLQRVGLWPFKTGYARQIREPVDLTFSAHRMVLRDEPWVVSTEQMIDLCPLNSDPEHMGLYRHFIEKVLASHNCKKILPWWDITKKGFLANLDCKRFIDKIETVYGAVPAKPFSRGRKDGVNLLFVGTFNRGSIPTSFQNRGGLEVLEAFSVLRRRYDNLSLTLRCPVPDWIRTTYRGVIEKPNVRVVDRRVSDLEFERIFEEADILLHPSYTTPSMTFLDAMSHGLPIITTDVWANSEYIQDGVNGLLIPRHTTVPDYSRRYVQDWFTNEFAASLREPDKEVAKNLADSASHLIEDAPLRAQMGRAGRAAVEAGEFSISRRNEKLRRIFEEAT